MKKKKLLWLLLPVTVCLFLESERRMSQPEPAVHEAAPQAAMERQETSGTKEPDSSSQLPTGIRASTRPSVGSSAESRSESTSPPESGPEPGKQQKSQFQQQVQLHSRQFQQPDGTQFAEETEEEPPRSGEEESIPVEDQGEHGPYDPDTQDQTEAPEESEMPKIQSEEVETSEPDLSCEETGHTWGVETDVHGDGTMFRKECSRCGAWEKRTAIFSDPVEFWWLQWIDEEGNLQRREFGTYEECREAEEGLEGAWNFGNDYREELAGWEITSSEGYRYTTE